MQIKHRGEGKPLVEIRLTQLVRAPGMLTEQNNRMAMVKFIVCKLCTNVSIYKEQLNVEIITFCSSTSSADQDEYFYAQYGYGTTSQGKDFSLSLPQGKMLSSCAVEPNLQIVSAATLCCHTFSRMLCNLPNQ